MAKTLCSSFHQEVESISPLLALELDLLSAVECCGSNIMPVLSLGLKRLYTLLYLLSESYHHVSKFRLACWMTGPLWPQSSQPKPSWSSQSSHSLSHPNDANSPVDHDHLRSAKPSPDQGTGQLRGAQNADLQNCELSKWSCFKLLSFGVVCGTATTN